MCRAAVRPRGAEHLADPRQDRRDLVDPGHQAVRDRRDRARRARRSRSWRRSGRTTAPRPGTQATDGRLCRPDSSGPIAARTTRTFATSRPSGVAITQRDREPDERAADRGPEDRPDAGRRPRSRRTRAHTSIGAGTLYSSVIADAQTSCQTSEEHDQRHQRRQAGRARPAATRAGASSSGCRARRDRRRPPRRPRERRRRRVGHERLRAASGMRGGLRRHGW